MLVGLQSVKQIMGAFTGHVLGFIPHSQHADRSGASGEK